MTELLTAAQMRAIEAAAIASGEVTGLELMERAGRGVFEAIFEEWPQLRATHHEAVVLCGPGNNGGDGFVVARLLKALGWGVEVVLYGPPETLPPDARANYERWLEMGEVADFSLKNVASDLFQRTAQQVETSETFLVIDALFGTGVSRPLEGDIVRALGLVSDLVEFCYAAVVAIDTPSGLCADSGSVLGFAPQVSLTVTFHRAKLGHYLNDGAKLCGKVRVVDLGLTAIEPAAVTKLTVPAGLEKRAGHKYAHGHALIVSGTHGRAGAARLAARGALRIGAGVVSVASPPAAMAENAARMDAIMLREVAGTEDLAVVLADQRINALCLGPGMGTGPAQAELLALALGVPPPPAPPHGREGRSLVLDADALTILSQRPDLFAALQKACVLTPHAGEFARLFPEISEKLNAPATKGPAYSKVDATREAAARAGCVVVFKGPDTVIADPSGRAAINAAVYDRAAPWLATAGSGDVLAGFITGLLARGFAPFDAACTGAWLHVECARSFGPGLIAEDLPEELPKVFRALGL
jgi:ADP-dependent NAD(P)H-hydrate dehydratase / NAD(P)H-hydrate epimerase